MEKIIGYTEDCFNFLRDHVPQIRVVDSSYDYEVQEKTVKVLLHNNKSILFIFPFYDITHGKTSAEKIK